MGRFPPPSTIFPQNGIIHLPYHLLFALAIEVPSILNDYNNFTFLILELKPQYPQRLYKTLMPSLLLIIMGREDH